MNAESYLRKQGWKGSGHSLDSTGRGIKKPLLIAHKQDQLGLGKKKAAYTTDDQWWMRAFDQSLQSIGTGQESTLNQIRTKGINRGGLYGFFVKGEEIAGTIDDSTDASAPPSGASTPPTSDSDAEAPSKPAKTTEQANKRKRKDDDLPITNKKSKKERRMKASPRDPTKSKHGQVAASPDEQEAVDTKIAKLSTRKKAWYEERAAAKGQTLEQYLLRREQKSIKKVQKRNKLQAAKVATSTSTPPPMFMTDLEGDAAIAQIASTTTPGQPVLDPIASAEAFAEEELKRRRKKKKEAKKALPNNKAHTKKKVMSSSGDDLEEAMKDKKERKKAKKAEKAKKLEAAEMSKSKKSINIQDGKAK